MKLYYSPGACSLSPHIALCEAGLQFDSEQVDLRAKKTKSGADFWAINPSGKVPALELDAGGVLTEGPAIVQYIADQAPGTELAPHAGTPERYRLQEMLNLISTELHKSFSPLFRKMSEEIQAVSRENIGKTFALLDKRLASQQFLMGDHFTVADGYLFVILRWAKAMKVDIPANIATYFDRVAARPRVQEALRQEGLA